MRKLVLLFFLTAKTLAGQHPAYYNFTADNGLAGSSVYCIFQDSDKFIWFGTSNGVSRYDGKTFENFSHENGLPDNEVFFIGEDHKKRIWFLTFSGRLSFLKNDTLYNGTNHPLLKKLPFVSQVSSPFFIDKKGNQWISTYHGTMVIRNDDSVFHISGKNNMSNKIIRFWENPGGEILFINNTGTIGRISEKSELTELIQIPGNCAVAFFSNERVLFTSENTLYSWDYKSKNVQPLFCDFQPNLINSFQYSNDLYSFCTNSGVYISSLAERKFTTRDILLGDKRITGLLTDHEGNVWVSTLGNGVFMFPMIHVPSYSFNDERISSITTDKTGNIWAGFENGKYCMISQSGKIDRENYLRETKYGGNKLYIVLYSKLYDKVFLAGTQGLYWMNEKDSLHLPISGIKDAWEDQNGFICYVTSSGLFRFEPGKENISDDNLPKNQLYRGRCFAVAVWQKDIWFANENGLFVHRNGKNYPSEWNHLLKHCRISDISVSNKGDIWVCSEGAGIFIVNEKHCKQLSVKDGITSGICKTVYLQNDTVAWVGTNQGLNKIILYGNGNKIIKNFGKPHGLISSDISGITSRNDTLWVGTAKGISVFSESMLTETHSLPEIRMGGITTNKRYINSLIYPLRFNYSENFIKIHFTSSTFKDPGNTVFHFRILPDDSTWNSTRENSVLYPSLAPGNYTFEVFATGYQNKKGKIARLHLEILPPFWQTWWFRTLLIFSICVLVLIFYFVRIKKIKSEAEKTTAFNQKIADLKLEALKSQMNPHFIFNCLSTIQGFINTKREEEANRYLTEFSRLLRLVLENSMKSDISLGEEISMLKLYVSLESMRLNTPPDFIVENKIKDSGEEIRIPSMLIQPYIENAFRHGFPQLEKKGIIRLQLQKKENRLICIISDNGIGRKNSMKMKTKLSHVSRGQEITETRLSILGVLYGDKLVTEISDLYPGNEKEPGTQIKLIVPISEIEE